MMPWTEHIHSVFCSSSTDWMEHLAEANFTCVLFFLFNLLFHKVRHLKLLAIHVVLIVKQSKCDPRLILSPRSLLLLDLPFTREVLLLASLLFGPKLVCTRKYRHGEAEVCLKYWLIEEEWYKQPQLKSFTSNTSKWTRIFSMPC